MNKGKILGILKSKIFIGVVSFVIGVAIVVSTSPVNKLEESVATLTQEAMEKDSKIEELEAKVDEAKPWFEMEEEERKAEEEKLAQEKAEKEAKEEQARKEEEAKQQHKIGEKITFKYGSQGEFALTIDSVQLTNERNQFADSVKNVVEINYTVENLNMEELDFFMNNKAEFYDSEGFKCNSYPNSSGSKTYDIGKGKKASGKEFIGIEKSDSKYLEMKLGDTTYKWSL